VCVFHRDNADSADSVCVTVVQYSLLYLIHSSATRSTYTQCRFLWN